jgi:hypothetical protein
VCAPRTHLVETRTTHELHVGVSCWVGAVSGLPGLEVLSGVYHSVTEHGQAIYSIMGDVLSIHSAVEPMFGRFDLWDGSCG